MIKIKYILARFIGKLNHKAKNKFKIMNKTQK